MPLDLNESCFYQHTDPQTPKQNYYTSRQICHISDKGCICIYERLTLQLQKSSHQTD